MSRNYEGKFGLSDDMNSADDLLNNLFNDSLAPSFDSAESELDVPILTVNLDEVNNDAKTRAEIITKKLSDYYFDPVYIEKHPYIKNKISQEVDAIRRLLKMLVINEKAQDTLIQTIAIHSGKGAIYSSLTTLQNTMLSIQTKLDSATSALEQIFMEMQENCELTFEDKAKEQDDNGEMVTRGSREFIRDINNMLSGTKTDEDVDMTIAGDIVDFDPIAETA